MTPQQQPPHIITTNMSDLAQPFAALPCLPSPLPHKLTGAAVAAGAAAALAVVQAPGGVWGGASAVRGLVAHDLLLSRLPRLLLGTVRAIRDGRYVHDTAHVTVGMALMAALMLQCAAWCGVLGNRVVYSSLHTVAVQLCWL